MITPLDIENKKFNKQMMNGYNVDEVDDFLDEIIVDFEKNYKDVSEMTTKIEELTESLKHYKEIEETLQNTLIMAQKTAEEVKNVAKEQADKIISDAKKQSEELVSSSRQDLDKSVNELNQEIRLKERELDELKKQFDIYKVKMEALLMSQLELLKGTNKTNE